MPSASTPSVHARFQPFRLSGGWRRFLATIDVASGLAASTSCRVRVRTTLHGLTNGERTVTAWTDEVSGQTVSPPAPYACRAHSAPWIDTER